MGKALTLCFLIHLKVKLYLGFICFFFKSRQKCLWMASNEWPNDYHFHGLCVRLHMSVTKGERVGKEADSSTSSNHAQACILSRTWCLFTFVFVYLYLCICSDTSSTHAQACGLSRTPRLRGTLTHCRTCTSFCGSLESFTSLHLFL